ncbi:MAG: 6-carboxytetrahydropterin synthase QueD [Blastocatellia bacterium]|nr:6-carboxytetrahydropterin synthase QueD [Blastocatellia bacterium]
MYEVMIETEFSSAHALRGVDGELCENMHGHNWKIEIYVCGPQLNEIGLLVDFVELSNTTKRVVEYLDHKVLNETPPFDRLLNPSAENVARYILGQLSTSIDNQCRRVYKVRVWESSRCSATYQVDVQF